MMRILNCLHFAALLLSVAWSSCCNCETRTSQKQAAKPSRYGDPFRNLPAWELEKIERGRSSREIDAEFERRYPARETYDEWYRRVGPIIPAGD